MSASREKKKRQNQGPVEPVDAGASKKGMNKTLKKVLITVVTVVVIAAIVFLGMVSSGFFEKHSTAAVASGHELTPAMVNHFYQSAYQSMQSFLTYLVDPNTPLDEQEYAGDGYDTWADYLMDYALNNAAAVYAVYDEAVANGYTLSESGAETVDYNLQMFDLYAAMNGFSSTDAYMTYVFGTGCTVESYREYLNVVTLAEEYRTSIQEGFTYSEDELDAYYSEHTEDFDAVNFRLFSLSIDSEAEDTEAALAECEETAKAMAGAAQGDEDAFLSLCLENTAEENQETYDADSDTLRENYVKASAGEAYRDWLFDDARQTGDTTYVANGETGYYVLYFVGQADYNWQLPNVRHILVYVSDTTDEDAMAAAEQEAQLILEEFRNGEQTEEAFAALADEKSDDSPEGGLIENVAPGVMVEAFEDWCYEDGREVGDTGIVESTYGYHVMYFSGYGQTYLRYKVENVMRSNDYSDWYAEVTADASYTTNAFSMRFTTK